MIDNNSFVITSKQQLFIIIGSTIATGILSLPRVATQGAGQDGWISVILGSLVPFFSLILIVCLGQIFSGLTIVEIAQLLFGKIIGIFLIILLIAYFIWFCQHKS